LVLDTEYTLIFGLKNNKGGISTEHVGTDEEIKEANRILCKCEVVQNCLEMWSYGGLM
jgi:hypothetical protein